MPRIVMVKDERQEGHVARVTDWRNMYEKGEQAYKYILCMRVHLFKMIFVWQPDNGSTVGRNT